MKRVIEKTKVEQLRFIQMLVELKADGITQNYFASAVGITHGFVSNIKAGKNALSLSVAKDIERAFPKYRAAWLLGLDEHPASKVDALKVLDSRVSAMSPERVQALLDCVQDFIDFKICKESV